MKKINGVLALFLASADMSSIAIGISPSAPKAPTMPTTVPHIQKNNKVIKQKHINKKKRKKRKK